jgi:hypothetical protein
MKLTPEQIRMILWASAIDPETLSFSFPLTTIVRIKGTGKDLIQAIFALFELCGNARPFRRDDGTIGVRPVREPWVVVAATSLEATTSTYGYFTQILSDEAIEHFGIDLGKELTYTANGGRMEAVTSQPRRIEGMRPTALTGTEAGLWVPASHGNEMFGAMERGAAKIPGTRILLSSNAFAVGEGSVLEAVHDDYVSIQEGRAIDTGLNYDSLSAPADTNPSDPDSLRYGIEQAAGDAHWLDIDRKLAVALSKRTLIENTMRFELNINAAPDEALYDALTWDALKVAELALVEGDTITLGLDVSTSDDASALVAIRTSDRAAFPLLIVERPANADETWRVDVGKFDHAIEQAFSKYSVVGFFSDVNPIQGHVERWEREYGQRLTAKFDGNNVVAADMRTQQRRFTVAHESLVSAIENGELKHNGDSTLRRHALNAHRRLNRFGLSFGKATKHSQRKVDAYAALMLADMARTEYLRNTPTEPEKKRKRSTYASW